MRTLNLRQERVLLSLVGIIVGMAVIAVEFALVYSLR